MKNLVFRFIFIFISMVVEAFAEPDISSDLYVSSAYMHNILDEIVFAENSSSSSNSKVETEASSSILRASISPVKVKDAMSKVSFYGDISDEDKKNRRFEEDPLLKEIIARLVANDRIKSVEFHIGKNKDVTTIQMRVTTPIFSEDFSFLNFKLQDEPVHYMYYSQGSSVYGVVLDKKEKGKEFRFFSRDGILLSLFSLKDNLYEGDYQTFYPNGKPKNAYVFKEGKENGHYQKYNSDGILLESGSYLDDKKDGLITFYAIPEDIHSDEKIVLYVEHYDQGRLIQRDFYKDKVISKVETY